MFKSLAGCSPNSKNRVCSDSSTPRLVLLIVSVCMVASLISLGL